MASVIEFDLEHRLAALGRQAKEGARAIAAAPREVKDQALRGAAASLRAREADILAANDEDVAAATSRGLSAAMIDRLRLDAKRLETMASALETIAALDDPVGGVIAGWQRPNGLAIERVRVPLGVVGIIYESRPNVTADAAGLCLKAGNAVILRGGSECFASNAAILASVHAGLEGAGLPAAIVQGLPTTDRAAVGLMLKMNDVIDVIVPRGGRSLIERVYAESRIPVLAHLDGNVHTYLHKSADPSMAKALVLNAKLRRTGVCGATETLLCDRSAAPILLPPILGALIEAGCEIRGDEAVRELEPRALVATEVDWATEFLDRILAVKVVADLDEAIVHIEHYGSHHTDCIVTQDQAAARRFLAEVDSAIVLHNASTQFADGGEFGMGAEIGIATGRLHARGPVGVEQLTTFKYVVRGDGQVRPV
ncbi:glutamate-5-semialdehyde dehydrogenase [Arboricoccus pini]|uniref:Gamma-glutamyl phosphate reductase n=1 Tax=Arboricoccus pini TaxID=1963835 RepID=A0A212Q2Y9_9PROT|nr:glutamate-5-semialdehyde dehydrogenase [Arboricoccus pini]SNB53569.1 glutamate-5-semialdehyde dehydrogenase [Arboricoccus pini]